MTTSVTPDAGRIWRAARMPAVIGLIVIAAAIVMALLRGSPVTGALDPQSPVPEGSRALATLLKAKGVEIEQVESTQDALTAAAGSTVLVTKPEWVLPETLADLRDASAAIVLVAPRGPAAIGATVDGSISVSVRQPGCEFDAAKAAGSATTGGVVYEKNGDAQLCYGGSVVHTGKVTLLGAPQPLTNAELGQEGNAALAMRVLGEHRKLVWFTPSLADPALDGGTQSFYDLVPEGWIFGAAQLAIAVVLFALWRARRLGPVIAEPLPVVVRAAETVEGRARLYRKAAASEHAGTTLRQATRDRLIPALGLPVDAGPAAVVDRVAELLGRQGNEIGALLYGSPPLDDAELVRLADALDALENEVRNR